MRATCLSTSVSQTDGPPARLMWEESSYAVTPGRGYIVYGAGTVNSLPCYLICTDTEQPYPEFVPIECFAPPEGLLPGGLTLGFLSLPDFEVAVVTGAYFGGDDWTYLDLVEGLAQASTKWRAFKTYVDFIESLAKTGR